MTNPNFDRIDREVERQRRAEQGGHRPLPEIAADVERLRDGAAARLAREALFHAEVMRDHVVNLHWQARRYAEGRRTYAPGMVNNAVRALLALGVPLNATGDGTLYAPDGDFGAPRDGTMGPEYSSYRDTVDHLYHHLDHMRREREARLAAQERVLAAVNAVRDHHATLEMAPGDAYAELFAAADALAAVKLDFPARALEGPAWTDNEMIVALSLALRDTLARSREKGRGGWNDPEGCPIEHLYDLLIEHARKRNLDFVDVAALAGMIWRRLEAVPGDRERLAAYVEACRDV